MQIQANIKLLRLALDRLAAIPGTNSPAAMLVRLEADFDGLTLLRRTDNSSLKTTCEVNVSTEGSITVGFQSLSDAVRGLQGPEIKIVADASGLILTSGRSRTTVAIAGDEQLLGDEGDIMADQVLNFPMEDLVDWLRSLLPGASTDSARPNVNGIIFCQRDGELELAATTGILLLVVKTGHQFEQFMGLLPNAAASAIVKIFSGKSGRCEIELTKTSLQITCGETVFLTAFSAEVPPQYAPICERKYVDYATVNRAELIREVRAGAPICGGERRSMELTASGKELELYGQTAMADHQTTLDAAVHTERLIIAPAPMILTAAELISEEATEITLRITDDQPASGFSIVYGDREAHMALQRIAPATRKKK